MTNPTSLEHLARPRKGFLARALRSRVRPGTLALWYLGGAGYLVRTPTTTLLIDPFLGPSNPPDWLRALPPPFEPDELQVLTTLSAVVLTHEHDDHTDPVALAAVARYTEALAVGPALSLNVAQGAGLSAARCRALEHGASLPIGDLKLTAVPMLDPAAKACNGYVLEAQGVTLLHCGDGLYGPPFLDLAERWRFDAVCVSVAANPPGFTVYMDEADAARAARDAQAAVLIPQHFDLWQGYTLDPERVKTAARWYCPRTRVSPARFLHRLSLSAPSQGSSG